MEKWKRDRKEIFGEEKRELLEKKQKEKKERRGEGIEKVEEQMEVHYRKREKKIWKENNIKDEEWRKYFKELLDGSGCG